MLDTATYRLGEGRAFRAPDVCAANGFRCDEDGDTVHCVDQQGGLLGRIKVSKTVSGGRLESHLLIRASHEVYAAHLNRCRAGITGRRGCTS